MEYHIDCPKGDAALVNADYATLQNQFVAHMEQQHGWTADRANKYFPANCWQRPVPVPVG